MFQRPGSAVRYRDNEGCLIVRAALGKAIGARIRGAADTPWREMVDVVQDVHENGVQESAPGGNPSGRPAARAT